jgi:hypothetical protein
MALSAFDKENFNEANYPAIWYLTKKNDEGHYQLACDNNIIMGFNRPG